MENKLCIHCSQKPPCPFQDGIFCKTTPCVRDNPGSNPGNGDDFVKIFQNMFGGNGNGNAQG